MSKTDRRVYLAPMLGITDVTFRTAFAEHYGGLEGSIAPFIKLTEQGKLCEARIKELLPKSNQKMAVIPQIMTNSGTAMLRFYGYLSTKLNYFEINWNLGCPAPTSADRGMGCGLMPNPDRVDRVLDQVFSGGVLKLSIKTRLGYESSHQVLDLIHVLNKYPIEAVVIHPRTGIQGYQGEVDLERFRSALDASQNPVGYSGDICSYEDWSSLVEKFPNLHSYFLGRGILRDPELGEKISGVDLEFDQPDRIRYRRFLHFLSEGYLDRGWGAKQTLCRLKTIWYYFAEGCNLTPQHRKKARRMKDIDSFIELASQPHL